ncbi:MAG TPA: hypothetical protein VFL85_04430 [Candidatus Saccharimonadales bacterium]|nr:hypothetical protein [Candidatus Saccharimonadales bacterium]
MQNGNHPPQEQAEGTVVDRLLLSVRVGSLCSGAAAGLVSGSELFKAYFGAENAQLHLEQAALGGKVAVACLAVAGIERAIEHIRSRNEEQ